VGSLILHLGYDFLFIFSLCVCVCVYVYIYIYIYINFNILGSLLLANPDLEVRASSRVIARHCVLFH